MLYAPLANCHQGVEIDQRLMVSHHSMRWPSRVLARWLQEISGQRANEKQQDQQGKAFCGWNVEKIEVYFHVREEAVDGGLHA